MKNKLAFFTTAAFLILGLAACSARNDLLPKGAPTAQLKVSVANFVKLSWYEAENGWIKIYNQDRSWMIESIVKEDNPSKEFIIPADQDVKFTLYLQKAGAGYDGGCGAEADINAAPNSKLAVDFTIKRVPGEKDAMSGCKMALLKNGKVIGEYEGKGKIEVYNVKVKVE